MVRLTNAPWGPLRRLRPDPADSRPRPPLTLSIDDAVGLGISGTADCVVREWRCPPAGLGGRGAHRWEDFEGLAERAALWLESRMPETAGIVLLGATMPQEIGLGIGMHLHRSDEHRWPARVYPLVWGESEKFVVPGLNLGRESWD